MARQTMMFMAVAVCIPGMSSADHLSFCYDPYPPYALGEDGAPEGGIKVELLNEVISRIDGVTASVILMPWKRCQYETAAGEFDGILPLFPNNERRDYLAFTIGSISESSVFWYHRNRFPADLEWNGDATQLSHLRLGMLEGGYLDTTMEQAFTQGAGITRAQSVESLMLMLTNDRVDLIATDASVGRYVLSKLGLSDEVTPMEPPIASRKSQFGLSKVTGADKHLDAFNKVLEELAEEGVIQQISDAVISP